MGTETEEERQFWEEALKQYLAPEVSHAMNQMDKEKYAPQNNIGLTNDTRLYRTHWTCAFLHTEGEVV